MASGSSRSAVREYRAQCARRTPGVLLHSARPESESAYPEGASAQASPLPESVSYEPLCTLQGEGGRTRDSPSLLGAHGACDSAHAAGGPVVHVQSARTFVHPHPRREARPRAERVRRWRGTVWIDGGSRERGRTSSARRGFARAEHVRLKLRRRHAPQRRRGHIRAQAADSHSYGPTREKSPPAPHPSSRLPAPGAPYRSRAAHAHAVTITACVCMRGWIRGERTEGGGGGRGGAHGGVAQRGRRGAGLRGRVRKGKRRRGREKGHTYPKHAARRTPRAARRWHVRLPSRGVGGDPTRRPAVVDAPLAIDQVPCPFGAYPWDLKSLICQTWGIQDIQVAANAIQHATSPTQPPPSFNGQLATRLHAGPIGDSAWKPVVGRLATTSRRHVVHMLGTPVGHVYNM
ncbi:hypothetical protein B0H10DRAFT_1955091 [Mycena sp. CBHHK59/15]|nr:hypothetical protein B0H10DRAFT_1955091 [Mycena sp. CBHHK59/15]